MVNDEGQIFTIEGVAAAILMVVTAYLVVSTTTVLTQQDVHIIDMQLQQLGNDALAMMDTPDAYGSPSILTTAVRTNDGFLFRENFLRYVNNTTNITAYGQDRLNYYANITYQNQSGGVVTIPLDNGDYCGTYYREKAVKVSRWVYIPSFSPADGLHQPDMPAGPLPENRTVLFEVLLWRE